MYPLQDNMNLNVPLWIARSRKNARILFELPRAGGEQGDQTPGLRREGQNHSHYSTSEDSWSTCETLTQSETAGSV